MPRLPNSSCESAQAHSAVGAHERRAALGYGTQNRGGLRDAERQEGYGTPGGVPAAK